MCTYVDYISCSKCKAPGESFVPFAMVSRQVFFANKKQPGTEKEVVNPKEYMQIYLYNLKPIHKSAIP